MRTTIAAVAAIALLTGCTPSQQTKFQAAVAQANQYVTLACKLDAKVVPIGLDAAPALATAMAIGIGTVATPAAGAAASGAVVALAQFDKVAVHPAVLALCAGVLGAGATVVQTPVAAGTLVAPVAQPTP